MPLPSWRLSLASALHHNESLAYAHYLQLATIRPDGKPANRTVVFRGFLDSSNQLKFICDQRSEKVTQIAKQPWGEACWYFPKTREQFRLLGTLTLIQADHPETALAKARQIQWQALSNASRLQFAWADPGQPRTEASNFNPPPPDPTQPPANFCLLLLDPIQVDHLELRGDPQNRYRHQYDPDQNWSTQSINP